MRLDPMRNTHFHRGLLSCLALAACTTGVPTEAQDQPTSSTPDPSLDDTAWGGEEEQELLDSDGDGLDDGQEGALGTDPESADTDADGTGDGAEVMGGTNPLEPLSHPYAGGYNVGYCADGLPTPTGPTGHAGYADQNWDVYRPGDVARDFAFVDQYGETVHLHSFCDRLVMLAFVGSGSDASLDLAATFQTLQDAYGSDGFQLLGLLVDQGVDEAALDADKKKLSSGEDADSANLELIVDEMVETFGIDSVPLLRLPQPEQAPGGTWNQYESDFALPTKAFLDGTMTVLSVDEYGADPRDFL